MCPTSMSSSSAASSLSYTALQVTSYGNESTKHGFHPIHFVQQMWKGFCLPGDDDDDNNNNIIIPQADNNNNDDESSYEQYFLVATSVPRCINLTSSSDDNQIKIADNNNTNNDNNNTTSNNRSRLMTDELLDHVGDCDHHNNIINTSLNNPLGAIISNDSYDSYDDEDNDIRDNDNRNENYIDDFKNSLFDNSIVLTSGSINRRARVIKGLEMFLSAILFIVVTIYMIQRVQQQQHTASNTNTSPSLVGHHDYHFHMHSKILNHPKSSSVIWRWHSK